MKLTDKNKCIKLIENTIVALNGSDLIDKEYRLSYQRNNTIFSFRIFAYIKDSRMIESDGYWTGTVDNYKSFKDSLYKSVTNLLSDEFDVESDDIDVFLKDIMNK